MKKRFKSLIAVLLCLSILPGTSLFALASEDRLKITVATDTHFSSFSDLGEFPSDYSQVKNIDGMLEKEIYYYASIQGQMDRESYAILNQLLSSFAESDDEYLLLAGDLTSGGRQSHIELAEILRKAEADSGKEIFVTSGNHDVENVSIEDFKQIYADFGYNQALSVHETSGSYTAELSGKYRLISIDTCIYGDVGGEINPSVLEWIRQQADNAKNDGKELIGMMHHSLLPHFALEPMINSDGYAELVQQLSDMGINIMFTGHLHANDIASAKTKSGTVYDIKTGSLIAYPHAYRHVTFGGSGVEIKTDYITEIDTADLMDGYNTEQLRRIEESFTDYSYGFFEAGMCRWLNTYVGSGDKLGRVLGLDKSSPAYTELDRLLRLAGNFLNLPIYDDGSTPGELDSIEEIANSKGYFIPESDYKMPYQIVATVMANFYVGDEKDMSAEVELTFTCLKAILSHFGESLIYDGSLNNLLKLAGIEIPQGILGAAAKSNLTKSVAEKLAFSLLTALLDGVATDYCEPGDINVVLEIPSKTAGLTFFERIIRILLDFLNTFKRLFNI